MPKQKTRKSVAKRLRVTGTGKYRRYRAGGRHLMTQKKNAKRRRRLRQETTVSKSERNRIKAALPYGL